MIIHLKTTDSTNSYIKREDPAPGTVVWADCQTAGRGRGDHSFASPSGGIYFSCLFQSSKSGSDGYISEEEALLLTPKAAVAVCMALEDELGLAPSVKWVNDIYLYGKKVCGILCEHSGDRYIAGIGINVSDDGLPDELRKRAGGILSPGEKLSLSEMEELINAIAAVLYSPMPKEEIIREYTKRLNVLGKDILFEKDGRQLMGKVLGINGCCNLIVKTEDDTVTLSSGEIEVI